MRLLSLMSILSFAVFCSVMAQEKGMSPSLASLVAAERAFARASVEKGVRESFLMFFADDGINFQPHPVNLKEAYQKRPAPPARPPVTLDWEPIYADVSQAGDLGYTTGPYTLSDDTKQRPTQHGYYFSVWKKQADGSWKVALDLGVSTPAPSAADARPAFRAARQVRSKTTGVKADPAAERAALLNLERKASGGGADALLAHFDDDARLHRNEMFPLVGRDAIRAFLSGKNLTFTWEPIRFDVAQSGDLGYTYGSYELKGDNAPAGDVEKGYYANVWKRDEAGQWKLAMHVSVPLPPEQK
ncbi:MAG TPA: nuclear transport factor 2 family protein [Blastocatellia bacterium]|nr:nuclear transport factor 2 family protein [Blastocatellia bacterium]